MAIQPVSPSLIYPGLCLGALFLAALGINPPRVLAQAEAEPVLRLEAEGPTSYVTSIAFSADGKTLYAGSWDKTVYVWKWDDAGRQFRIDPISTLRVPIGPGLDGAINTIAVSDDGRWVAAAGMSPMRGAADFRRPGLIVPTFGGLSREMRLDAGTICVFNTRTGQAHSLRGHAGEVRSLTFAPSPAESPLLISAAREWNETAGGYEGVVRTWPALDQESRPLAPVLPVPSAENAIWTTWPKLAARQVGAEPTDVEVAVAWGDGVFRVWNVAQGRLREASSQGRIQDVVALNKQTGQFLSGAMGDDDSFRLRAWKAAGNASPLEVDPASSVELASDRVYRIIPRGLGFAASAPGKQSDLLCTIIHRNDIRAPARDQYELWLYPAPYRGIAPRTVALWVTGPPPRRTPQLATSPTGEHLAVSREGEIYVYSVAGLLAGNRQATVLRSAGSAFDEVAFVRQRAGTGTPLGLLLTETRPPAAAGAQAARVQSVFDLQRGGLAPRTANDGWTAAPAPAGNWRVDIQATAAGTQPAGSQLVVSQGGARRGVIPLRESIERGAYALGANVKPPVVALASYENGLPSLHLFDATTGQQVRQLSAHSARIRSLAFSDDGQLLASVGDDESVCVWRLSDLDRILGKRGKTPGIAVRQTEGGLLVKLDDTASASGLKSGDILTGQVTADGTKPWTDAAEFYLAFWNAAPGETIRVARRQANGAEDQVALSVMQGIDERKPLFSLFMPRAAANQPREWIAWSPLGPYQSSDRLVERYLGWHFNTGRPEEPVTFAGASQYREKYFRSGLIDALIMTGQPPEAAQANRPLPRPVMDLIVEGGEIGAVEDADEVLVRQPPTKASLVVADLAADNIERVELSLDGKSIGTLEPQDDGTTWSLPIDTKDWKPSEHRVKAVVHTREAAPQEFAIERKVRYQAPPPQVAIDNAPPALSGLSTQQGSLVFSASVEPGQVGEPTEIVLKKKEGASETILKRWTTEAPLQIQETIELPEGGSQFELVARNRNALPGFEAHETQRKQMAINRQVAAPPVLASARVDTLDAGEGEAIDVGSGPRRVTVDRVKLSGEIAGNREELVVESSAGTGSAALRVAPSTDDSKPVRFASDEIKLQPGLQTLQLRRKQFAGPAITTTIELDYRPPLPELVLEQPSEPELALIAGRDPAVLNVLARMQGTPPDPSFKAALLLNGEAIDIAPAVDLTARTISAQVPLPSGETTVELKVSDAWNDPHNQLVANVKYLHLPSIDRVEPKNEQLPVLEVVIAGQSASPVTRLEVGPTVLPPSAIQFDPAGGRWQATAQIPRQSAAYDLAVQVYNRDGQALAPSKLTVPAWRQVEQPPLIELSGSGNVTSPEYELRFTVRSRSKIRSVNIKQNRMPVAFDPQVADLKPDSRGEYVFAASLPVKLASGDNRFDVLAANDGGSDVQYTTVNYIDPPARIVIDRVETIGGPEKISVPIVIDNRRAFAQNPAPTGKVLIHGQVKWPLYTDKSYLKRKQRLQLWVNGFQQAPGVLQQPTKDSPTSQFTAFAVLNKDKNSIQLALPDLTPDITTLFDVQIACNEPIIDQRLHVLIVGVGSPRGSEPELEKRVLAALKAKPLRDKLWQSDGFTQIAAYGPLVGNDITPQQVRGQLSTIKLKIDELYHANRSSSRPANDVVMIYLQGGTLLNVGDSFYVTTRPTTDPRTSRAISQLEPRILFDVAVQSKTLANFLTHTTGAHVLMLDVTGNLNMNEEGGWPDDSRAAILRYTWLKASQSPAQARLLAALPEALQNSSSLAQLDAQFAEYQRALASQFPESTSYSRRVPEILQSLLLGKAP